ncbi:MAG: RNA pseudouridine synthase [Gammaproteobacteria bacterium]|nr:RNA pseudouridine synthase [Gammaproteobacteria bacterium]
MRFSEDWVLFENRELLVLNKPSGLAVLQDRTTEINLWALLAARGRFFLVHRIDKGTSGVLILAKSQAVQRHLTKLFASRNIGKFYVAQVLGAFPDQGTLLIDLPLKPGRKSRYRVAGERADIRIDGKTYRLARKSDEGVEALTRIRLLARQGERSLVMASPLTGRTHQLRVHLAWTGYPIAGDNLYGKPGSALQNDDRMRLHCHRLVIPGFGSFSAPVPWT